MLRALAASRTRASGATVRGGRTNLPAWVPEAGTFANISTNTLLDVAPAGWPNGDAAGPFTNWSGGQFNPDFSALGALSIHGSGHLSAGMALWAGTWHFDLDDRAWKGRNVPSQALLESADYNGYYESTVAETLGHTYAPHTYDGLAIQSAANGGGSAGSLIRVFMPGAGIAEPLCVHRFDLSSPNAPATRVIDDIGGASSSSYPATAVDEGRGGIWVLRYDGSGPLQFISFAAWSVTTHSGVQYNAYGNQSLIHIPAPWDCLVGVGSDGLGGVDFSVRVCPIVGGVPQGFTSVTPAGTAPADGRCGGQWSTLLACIVSYRGAGSYEVHKLTPPAAGGSLLAGWAWASETLTGAGGATPSVAINPNNSLPYDNGAWSRFVEVPAARCFLWCEGVNQPVQAWRLTGM